MRLFCVGIYLVLFFFTGLFMNIRVKAAMKKDKKYGYKVGNKIIRSAFSQVLFICGVKRVVKGMENIPDCSALYVGNHRSYFDILTTHVTVNRPLGFVAKSEMTNIPFLSTWMHNIGCLFLDRHDNKKALKTILEGVKMLKEDYVSLEIYPEGTRGHSEEMAPFKKGSFKMAEKAKVPIVPVAIINSDNVFENNPAFRKIRSKKVYLNFGKPIDIEQLSDEEKKHIDSYVQNIIAGLINELKEEYMKA